MAWRRKRFIGLRGSSGLPALVAGVLVAGPAACQSPAADASELTLQVAAPAALTSATSAFAADHDWRFYRHAGDLGDLEKFLGGVANAKNLVPAPRPHVASKRSITNGAQLRYAATTTPPPTTNGAQLRLKLTTCGYPALAPSGVSAMAARLGLTLPATEAQTFVDDVYVMREPDHSVYCIAALKGDRVTTMALAPLHVASGTSTLGISATIPTTDCAEFVNLVATTAGCP